MNAGPAEASPVPHVSQLVRISSAMSSFVRTVVAKLAASFQQMLIDVQGVTSKAAVRSCCTPSRVSGQRRRKLPPGTAVMPKYSPPPAQDATRTRLENVVPPSVDTDA